MAVTDAFRSLRVPALPGGSSLDDLLQRWRDALLLCLPDSLRRILARRQNSLVAIPRGVAIEVYHQQGTERQALGEFGADDNAALKALVTGLRGHRPGTIIELPAIHVLKRVVSFPVQVRTNLDRVMRYEIDRVSPFQVDQACFDIRVRDATGSADKLVVELALCRRDLVKDWLRRLAEAGAPVDRVTWEGAWPHANLLPPEDRLQRRGGAFGVARLLLVAALVLLSAVLVTPLWQKNRLLDDLDLESSDAKSEAEEVQQVRTALERAREGSVTVLQQKLKQPLMVDLLRELTERLPDDTWVQNMDVREGEVQIRGESAQATALIGLLEKGPGISEVSFRSPVVQGASTGQERFHISFKYAREAPE